MAEFDAALDVENDIAEVIIDKLIALSQMPDFAGNVPHILQAEKLFVDIVVPATECFPFLMSDGLHELASQFREHLRERAKDGVQDERLAEFLMRIDGWISARDAVKELHHED